jgi:putative two-component system response regulator
MWQMQEITTTGPPAEDGSRQVHVLIVDDDAGITTLLEKLLTSEGYVVAVARDGRGAMEAIRRDPPDVILLDVVMPGDDGYSICRTLKSDAKTRLIPVVLITGLADRENRISGLDAGADDFLTKPIDRQELLTRVRSLARLKRYTDDLDSASSIIMAFASMIETRVGYTEGHCHRMANYATALGRRLGLSPDDLQTLYRGGFLHDVGMLAIPDSLLSRRGPLEPSEFELVKSHTVISAPSMRFGRSCGIIMNAMTGQGILTDFAVMRSRSSPRSSGWLTSTTRSRPKSRTSTPTRSMKRC